jgi:calcium/calmodulin-dependent protein kinase I
MSSSTSLSPSSPSKKRKVNESLIDPELEVKPVSNPIAGSPFPLSIISPLKLSRKDHDINDRYEVGPIIGTGGFAEVKKATSKASGESVAIKIVDRSQLSENEDYMIVNEIELLKSINHPNIVKLYEHLTTPSKYFLVLEFIAGGELFDRIVTKSHYSEKEARDVTLALFKTIKYCHDTNIVHR